MLAGCITLSCNDLFIWGKQHVSMGPAHPVWQHEGLALQHMLDSPWEERASLGSSAFLESRPGWVRTTCQDEASFKAVTGWARGLQAWFQASSLPLGECRVLIIPFYEWVKFKEIIWLAQGHLAKQWGGFPIRWVRLHFALCTWIRCLTHMDSLPLWHPPMRYEWFTSPFYRQGLTQFSP